VTQNVSSFPLGLDASDVLQNYCSRTPRIGQILGIRTAGQNRIAGLFAALYELFRKYAATAWSRNVINFSLRDILEMRST